MVRYLLVAGALGLATIFISIFALHNNTDSFETDSEPEPRIELGQTYSGESYDFTPTALECDTYNSVLNNTTREGCILHAIIKNTTVFEMILNLDGDYIVDESGNKYESSDILSREFIENNGFALSLDQGEQVTGGIFFEAPQNVVITEVGVYENASQEPILISL